MTAWILIGYLALGSINSGASVVAEFATRQACEYAAEAVRSSPELAPEARVGFRRAICVPKGAAQ